MPSFMKSLSRDIKSCRVLIVMVPVSRVCPKARLTWSLNPTVIKVVS